MFRSIVLILAVTLLAMPVLAGDLQAGVKGGVNLSNTRTDIDGAADTKSRTGMSIGGFVGVPVNEMFSIQPEALFSMKGSKDDADPEETLKLNYIEIPVLAKVSLLPEAPAHPSLFLGPALGINISAETQVQDADAVDVKDAVKTTDFGLVFGGGLDMPVGAGTQSIGLDVRYTLGLSSWVDADPDPGFSIKNGALSLMGTFRFL
jgi:hypothetical protein